MRCRRKRLIPGLVSLFALVLVGGACGRNAAEWVTETVDGSSHAGVATSLTVDRHAVPQICAYIGPPNYQVKWAHNEGGAWQVETLSDDPGRYVSLALDASDYLHVAFGANLLVYGWYDGSVWHLERVETDLGFGGGYPSLALDVAGVPHMSYWDDRNRVVKYARQDDSSWHIETVDVEVGLLGGGTSLALDQAGLPHISYCATSGLRYAHHDGVRWQIEEVDIFAGGGHTSIALDANGQPHIGYFGGDNSVKHAYHDGAGWQVKTVDREGLSSCGISLMLDAAGRPQLSYCTGAQGVKYAFSDGIDWNDEIVDSWGCFVSMALDGDGRPHVAYWGEDGLMYACRSGPALVP